MKTTDDTHEYSSHGYYSQIAYQEKKTDIHCTIPVIVLIFPVFAVFARLFYPRQIPFPVCVRATCDSYRRRQRSSQRRHRRHRSHCSASYIQTERQQLRRPRHPEAVSSVCRPTMNRRPLNAFDLDADASLGYSLAEDRETARRDDCPLIP